MWSFFILCATLKACYHFIVYIQNTTVHYRTLSIGIVKYRKWTICSFVDHYKPMEYRTGFGNFIGFF